MAKEENPLFVGITDGAELRRDILECSKGILGSLQDYERFKSVREEKLRLIHQFREDVKKVSSLMSGLRKHLPKVKEVGIKKPKVKEAEVVKPKVVKIEKPKETTELERLEAELNDIEGKLNNLS